MFNQRIYLDYASITPVDTMVVREMRQYSPIKYANPSSWYKEGVNAKNALDNARKDVANFINAHPDEIFFTSGGTEANNLAVIGAVEALHEKGVEYEKMHVIVSIIEHSSIRECANFLNSKGVSVDSIGVGRDGIVDLNQLKNKIKPNTVLISIMLVNNEIGTIEPIKEIAKIIRQFKKTSSLTSETSPFNFQDYKYPIFHTDASQGSLYEKINVEQLGVDLLTIDGTKIYGPRGIGALFIRRDTPITSVIHGGGQESGLRSGTENIPAIMGLAKSIIIAEMIRDVEYIRISKLKEYFYESLKKIRVDIEANPKISKQTSNNKICNEKSLSDSEVFASHQSPHILNVSIPKIDGEFFIMQLDAKGISCSTKSSCLRDENESYVLKSIGADSKTSIRFSFGRSTTKRQINRVIKVISGILAKKTY